MKAWFNRNLTLLFFFRRCFKMELLDPNFSNYNDIIQFPDKGKARTLGNGWFVYLHKKKIDKLEL